MARYSDPAAQSIQDMKMNVRPDPVSIGFAIRPCDAKQLSDDFFDRIIVLIDDALLERDNCVIGNRYVFRADLGTALGDIAIANAL